MAAHDAGLHPRMSSLSILSHLIPPQRTRGHLAKVMKPNVHRTSKKPALTARARHTSLRDDEPHAASVFSTTLMKNEVP